MTQADVYFQIMLQPEVASLAAYVSLTFVTKSDVSSSISQNIREVRCEIFSSHFPRLILTWLSHPRS